MADFSAHIFYFNTSHIFAYLWITILRQDLQHRRFSALNVSHKNQFTSHHQRLCISSFLHDPNNAPEDLFSRKRERQTNSRTAQQLLSQLDWETRCLALEGCPQLIWLNLPLRLFIQASSSQWERNIPQAPFTALGDALKLFCLGGCDSRYLEILPRLLRKKESVIDLDGFIHE